MSCFSYHAFRSSLVFILSFLFLSIRHVHLGSSGTRLLLLLMPTRSATSGNPGDAMLPSLLPSPSLLLNPSLLLSPSRLLGARPTFSLLLKLLSLRALMVISLRELRAGLLPLALIPMAALELLDVASEVRGRRLFADTNSPLTRRGIPVGPSLLRGLYSAPSRSRSTAAVRRGLAATSI